MRTWRLEGDAVGVGVTEIGGMLDRVRFETARGSVEPLHVAPWVDEPGEVRGAEVVGAEIPLLRHLRGDFLCAPFGDSDVLADEDRPHGRPANGAWRLLEEREHELRLELDGPVSGATVRKSVRIVPGHPVVYQRHELVGGGGRLPIGHHAMLRAEEPLRLSFSRTLWGATPPEPVETVHTSGRSLLTYPQTFERLDAVATAAGERVDLTTYPTLEGSEEIVLLAADAGLAWAWSAAVAPRAGWAWFAVKDPRVLRSTVLWLSNGGRDAPPWSGRHRRAIGIEEVTACFHLGHRASLDPDNPVAARGVPTNVALRPEGRVVVTYAFGVAAIPAGFERVREIAAVPGGLRLTDGDFHVDVPFDLDFITASADGGATREEPT